jgi:hypothetical protein
LLCARRAVSDLAESEHLEGFVEERASFATSDHILEQHANCIGGVQVVVERGEEALAHGRVHVVVARAHACGDDPFERAFGRADRVFGEVHRLAVAGA